MAIGNVIFSRKPLTREDVVDNLNSTVANLPLSARQGSILNNKFSNIFHIGGGDVGKDFDTLTTPGFYPRVLSGKNSNSPGFLCYLLVFKSDPVATYKQIAIGYSETRLASRIFDNRTGKWSEWKEFITEASLKWQLIGSVAGGTALNFDTTKYTEFLVRVYDYGRALMSVNVLSQELPTNRALSTYIFQNNSICITVECANTYFQIIQMFENNAIIDIIPDTVTLTVYGR